MVDDAMMKMIQRVGWISWSCDCDLGGRSGERRQGVAPGLLRVWQVLFRHKRSLLGRESGFGSVLGAELLSVTEITFGVSRCENHS